MCPQMYCISLDYANPEDFFFRFTLQKEELFFVFGHCFEELFRRLGVHFEELFRCKHKYEYT